MQKGNDVLRKIAKEVPLDEISGAKIKRVIKKLKQAVTENQEAIAAAAPQIGESLRVFVVSDYIFASEAVNPDEEQKEKSDYGCLVFINPKIIKKSKEQKIMSEGCLSAEGLYGAVKRAEKIKVEACDENGKKFIRSGSGLFAQVIQHETDHLDGVLFTDKATAVKKYEPRARELPV